MTTRKRTTPSHTRKSGLAATPTRADEPLWRRLTILAQDPEVRHGLNKQPLLSMINIPAEPFLPGPCGARIKVVDYDATHDRYYFPRPTADYGANGELQDPYAAVKPADVSRMLEDPHFHQQQVYAVAMRTLCQFERALGRRVEYGFSGHQLHVAPHAFAEANAYYSRESRALFLGYFPNEKGEQVYTCLSHDIIAHEMAHALLDGIRPRYIEPSSPDQAAFHEGFADIVALLLVLGDQRLIEALMVQNPDWDRMVPITMLEEQALGELALLGLAESMGTPLSDGRATALRRSATRKPNTKWRTDPAYDEPHDRGEILVAMVMQAFLRFWAWRLKSIGEVQKGMADAKRVAEEGANAAEHLMLMCIRALDYAPTIDLEFDDFLSALLTADRETMPNKPEYRAMLRESFEAWGIVPVSRPETDGCWLPFDHPLSYATIRYDALQRNRDEAFRFLWRNAESLRIVTDVYTEVGNVRAIARVAEDGLVVRETAVDYVQIRWVRGNELEALGLVRPPEMNPFREFPLFGGGVLIFDEFARLKFSIGNGLDNTKRQQRRLDHLAKSGYFEFSSDKNFNQGYFARLHMSRPGRGEGSGGDSPVHGRAHKGGR